MYDRISWINRNYKKSGRSTFEKVSGFWPGILYYNFRKSGKKWAVRKGMRQEKAAIVNVYELSGRMDDFKGYYLLKKKMRNGSILYVHVEKDSR